MDSATEMLRELDRAINVRMAERTITHDESQAIAGLCCRWVRSGRPGIWQDDHRRGWACGCPEGENLCGVALPLCEMCGWRRPGAQEEPAQESA